MTSAVISLSLFGMEKEIKRGIYHMPQELCTLPEQGLFIVALNTQTPDDYKSHKTPKFIQLVSCVSKNLHEVFNNPVIARDIITHSAFSKDGFDPDVAKKFNFPGAKKCLELSQQLYSEELFYDDIEKLFKQGAIINYQSSNMKDGSPLSYWTQKDDANSIWSYYRTVKIMANLIAFGADPNCGPVWDNNSFVVAIKNQKSDKLNVLLNYYTLMHGTSTTCIPIWQHLLDMYSYGSEHFMGYEKCPELIDLFMTNIPKENCNLGLMACITTQELREQLRNELMQRFIDLGADAEPVLPYLVKTISLYGANDSNSSFVQKFNILCNTGAFDKDTLLMLQGIRQLFDSLIIKLENNRPNHKDLHDAK